MKKSIESQCNAFIKSIDKLKLNNLSGRQLSTKVLYKVYSEISNEKLTKNDISLRNDIDDSSDIRSIIETVQSVSLTDQEFKEWSEKSLSSFPYEAHINNELYKLVVRLLDVEPIDSLLHVNAIDESFIFEASEYVKQNKESLLRLKTAYVGDNSFMSDIIQMRLVLSNMNYTRLDSLDKVDRIKPTKVFVAPRYSLLDKEYQHSDREESLWNDIVSLAKKMNDRTKIVALVPDNMLSRSSDAKYREFLLQSKLVESVISLPLRYYSDSLNINTSLLILSKDNVQVKTLDVARLFDLNEIKSAGTESITNYIYENYIESYCDLVPIEDLISRGSNLVISNIVTDSIYSGIDELKQLSEVASIRKGFKGTATNFYGMTTDSEESNYYVLASSNIENGVINYDELMKIVDGSKYEKFMLKDGDLVLTNKSTKVKVAVASVRDKQIIVSGSMMIITPDSSKMDSNYLKMFLESQKGKDVLSKIQKGNVTTTITIEDLENIKVSCPPLSIQQTKVRNYIELQREYEQKKKELDTLQNKIREVFEDF